MEIQDLPRVGELVKQVGEGTLKRYIEYELIYLASLINVSGNLTDMQVQFIAAELVEAYPNESIGDFKQCFRMAAMGALPNTEKVFRLDSIIVANWFKDYLNHKYMIIEHDIAAKKKHSEERPITKDEVDKLDRASHWLEVWRKSIEDGGLKSVPSLTEAQVKKEGRPKPVAQSYPTTSEAEVMKRMLHIEYIKECYDARTGDPNEAWIPEDQWLKLKQL